MEPAVEEYVSFGDFRFLLSQGRYYRLGVSKCFNEVNYGTPYCKKLMSQEDTDHKWFHFDAYYDHHGTIYYILEKVDERSVAKNDIQDFIRGYNDYSLWVSQQGSISPSFSPTHKLLLYSMLTEKFIDTESSSPSSQSPTIFGGTNITLPVEIIGGEIKKYMDVRTKARLDMKQKESYHKSPYRRYVDILPTFTLFWALINNDPYLTALSLYKGGCIETLVNKRLVIKSSNRLICQIIYNFHRISGIAICGIDDMRRKWLKENEIDEQKDYSNDSYQYPSLEISKENGFEYYIPLNDPSDHLPNKIWKSTSHIRAIFACYSPDIILEYLNRLVETFREEIPPMILESLNNVFIPFYEGKDVIHTHKEDEEVRLMLEEGRFDIHKNVVAASLWLTYITHSPSLLYHMWIKNYDLNYMMTLLAPLFIGIDTDDVITLLNEDNYYNNDEFGFTEWQYLISLKDERATTLDDFINGSSLWWIDLMDDIPIIKYSPVIMTQLLSLKVMERMMVSIDEYAMANPDHVGPTVGIIASKNMPARSYYPITDDPDYWANNYKSN